MSISRFLIAFVLTVVVHAQILSAQTPNAGADVVIFKNGDTLTGNVLRTTAATIEFASPVVGHLTLKWSDVKRLQMHHAMDITEAGTGAAHTFANPTITATSAGPKLNLDVAENGQANTLAVSDVQSVIGTDKCSSGIASACTGWRIAKFKASTAFLETTQHQQTYSAELSLLRNWYPQAEGWPHERTLIQLLPSYDDKKKSNKPGSSNVTQNYQGKFQQLFFITNDNFFAKVVADLYHNNSLGLYVQQAYGGGVGVIVHDLELDADLRFIGEHFYRPTPSVGLFGTQLSERYSFGLNFIRPGATLSETGIITPVFNASRAWQGQGDLDLVIPISATLGFTTTLSDNYVENAPPQFRKNYLKTSVGLQFTPAKH